MTSTTGHASASSREEAKIRRLNKTGRALLEREGRVCQVVVGVVICTL